jgi:hypothetical protein
MTGIVGAPQHPAVKHAAASSCGIAFCLCVSNCQFSRRIQDGATLRGARYLPYADAHT